MLLGLWALTQNAFEPLAFNQSNFKPWANMPLNLNQQQEHEQHEHWHKQPYSSYGPMHSEAQGHKNLAPQADQYK